jgi:hypothetical protein
MERFEQLVLDRAFEMPELRARTLLRRKALSLAAFGAAVMYRESEMYGKAAARAIRSLLLWPFPHSRADLPLLTRLKFLCLMPRYLFRRSSGAVHG